MNIIEREGVTFKFAHITDNEACRNWVLENFNKWEPFTFQSFRRAANPSKTAIDIGAWVGLTGIWLSKNFKNVICVEADKLSLKSLELNMNASDCNNYSIIPNAIHNINTSLYFGPNSFKHDSTLNESMSQLKSSSDKQDDYRIDTVTLKDIVKNIPVSDIGLLKVDIEGGEENVIEDVMAFSSTHKIPILLSFHISWWKDKNVNRYIHLFDSCTMTTDIQTQPITDLTQFLVSHPFATLFCTYP